MYITDIEVNNGRKSAIFKFDQVDIFVGISYLTWHSRLPDIKY